MKNAGLVLVDLEIGFWQLHPVSSVKYGGNTVKSLCTTHSPHREGWRPGMIIVIFAFKLQYNFCSRHLPLE